MATSTRPPSRKKFARLENNYIPVHEAAKAYGIPAVTLYWWAGNDSELIRTQKEGKRLLLNEADVAYCTAVYKKRGGGGRGKPIFTAEGEPFEPKPKDLTQR